MFLSACIKLNEPNRIPELDHCYICGELALSGELRPVRGALAVALEARYVRGMPREEWVLIQGFRNETWDAAGYGFSALEDYAGFEKPNDMLERLAKDLVSTEPPKPPAWQTNKEQRQPRNFQPPPPAPGTFVPRWKRNAERSNTFRG